MFMDMVIYCSPGEGVIFMSIPIFIENYMFFREITLAL